MCRLIFKRRHCIIALVFLKAIQNEMYLKKVSDLYQSIYIRYANEKKPVATGGCTENKPDSFKHGHMLREMLDSNVKCGPRQSTI